MSQEFHLIERAPTVEEYARFREEVGWSEADRNASLGIRNIDHVP